VTITNKVSLKSVNGGNTPVADVVDAPTIGSATAGIELATVTFTAATTGGAATSYGAISTPGSITGTSATSPISVTGLTGGTAYTFKTYGINTGGTWSNVLSAASNSVTPTVATAFESIASASPAGTTTTTFSSIVGTYSSLQLRINGIIPTGLYNSILIQFNGDTASNYSFHQLAGNNETTSGAGTASATYMVATGYPYGSAVDSYPTGAIVDIHDYASTTKFKTIRSFAGWDHNVTASSEVCLHSGNWRNTAAVTSIRVWSSVNFGTGTSIALYGIK
jgi:hypothetical protein